ncbi:MAG: tetratricopeptide repeat protein [Candidatus Omnitrophica bacterium]|nr:tetratricopeptide repeat protein [Candidatus Omnitrophota bacterium]
MPRRRLKHKQVIETIEQDDFQVALGRVKSFWQETIHPYEGRIWTGVIVVVVAVIGSLWWRNHHSAQISDANQILAQARTNFESGDTNGALLELDKVLPQGEFYQPGLEVAAELVKANIAFASGEYENAISILTRLVDIAPDSLRADLYYQLSTAQESKGDYNGALQSLGHVEKYLGPEPDEKDTERKPSVWDRYYFQKGRIFLKMKNEPDGMKYLLKVSRRSEWIDDASREIAWWKARPSEALPITWASAPK